MKPSILGLIIAAVAFAASTAYLTIQLQDERAQADQVADTMRALNARIAELEKTREQTFVSGGFGDGAPGQGAVSMGPPPMEKNEVTGENVEISRAVNLPPPRSEAFQKMMRSNLRANNKRIYADLGTELGLSKEDTSKLIDLLTDQQVENFARAREAHTTDAAERNRMFDEAAREDQAEIESFLGVSKAAALQDYQESIPARQETDVVARQLEGADVPLSAEQHKRMLAALIEERKRIPMPKMSEGTSPEDYSKVHADWQSDYNERVSAQANSILSSEQLTAYNEYQQWQKEMREQVATRRGRSGTRMIPGSNVQFSAVTMPIAGEAVVLTGPPPEETPRKPK